MSRILVDASNAAVKIRAAMLVATCLIASSVHLLLAAVLEIDAPAYQNILPRYVGAWLPVLALIVWFNALVDGRGRFLMRIDATALWLMLVVAILGLQEIGLATAAGRMANPDLVFDVFWLGVIYFALYSFRSLPGGYVILLRAFTGCAALISVLYLTVPQHGMLRLGIQEFFASPYRPILDNPNALAYGSALACLLAFSRLMSASTWQRRFVWAALSLIIAAGVVGMKSRGAWLVLLAGSGVLVLIELWRRRRFGMLALIAALGLAAALGALSRGTLDDLLSLGRGLNPQAELANRGLTEGAPSQASVGLRGRMVQVSLETFSRHPFFGLGLESLRDSRIDGHSVHGLPFLVAASYGLVGIALIVGLLAIALRAAPLAASRTEYALALAVLVASAFALQTIPYWFAAVLGLMALNQAAAFDLHAREVP